MIPPSSEIMAENLRDISSRHLNKFVGAMGTVVRTAKVQSRELYKDFKCKQCGKIFTCHSDISEYSRFTMPIRCNGKVEKQKNPFFEIAKSMMKQIKQKEKAGGLLQDNKENGK